MALAGLDNLELVDLSSNVISTIQESPVAELSKLARFKVDSPSLLCDCNLPSNDAHAAAATNHHSTPSVAMN